MQTFFKKENPPSACPPNKKYKKEIRYKQHVLLLVP